MQQTTTRPSESVPEAIIVPLGISFTENAPPPHPSPSDDCRRSLNKDSSSPHLGEGDGVGTAVGAEIGRAVGAEIGTIVGTGSGTAVGAGFGTAVGAEIGTPVGAGVGLGVGVCVGAAVGRFERVGEVVGCAKTSPFVTQKCSKYGAERSWKWSPFSSINLSTQWADR